MQKYNAEELSLIDEQVALGEHQVRLLDATGELSKTSNQPMVVALWEVVVGPSAGLTPQTYHSCKVQVKYGKAKARGIAEAHSILKAYVQYKGIYCMPDMEVYEDLPLDYAERLAVAFKRTFTNGKLAILLARKSTQTYREKDAQGNEVGEEKESTRPDIRIKWQGIEPYVLVPSTGKFDPLHAL